MYEARHREKHDAQYICLMCIKYWCFHIYYDQFVCVGVCMCVCMCVYVHMCVCVCVCVCVTVDCLPNQSAYQRAVKHTETIYSTVYFNTPDA